MNDLKISIPSPRPSTVRARRRFGQAIAAYLKHMTTVNYSPQTIASQRKQLRHFQRYCRRRGLHQPGEACRQTVTDYQLHSHQPRKRDGPPLAAGTQRQWLIAVVSFYRWLVHEGILPGNPAAELEMPRTEHRLPKTILSPAEVERVLAVEPRRLRRSRCRCRSDGARESHRRASTARTLSREHHDRRFMSYVNQVNSGHMAWLTPEPKLEIRNPKDRKRGFVAASR